MPLIMNTLGFMHDYESGSGLPVDFPTALTSSVTMWFDATTYITGSNIWTDRLSSFSLDASGVTYDDSRFHFTQSANSVMTPKAGHTPRSASRGTLVITYRTSNTSSGSKQVGYNGDTLLGSLVHFGSGSSNIQLSRNFTQQIAPPAGELRFQPKFQWSGLIQTNSYIRSTLSSRVPVQPTYWPNDAFLTPINGLMSALTFSGSGAGVEQRQYWSHQGSGTNPQYEDSGSGAFNGTFEGVPSGSFLYLGGAVRQTDGVVDTTAGSQTAQFTGSIDNVLYFDKFLEETDLNTLRDYLY